MDAVRFGRALGFGARQAAKTVVSAVNAATAESPSSPGAAAASTPGPAAAAGPQAGPPAATARAIQTASAGNTGQTVSAAARPAKSAVDSRIAAQGVAQVQGVRRGLGRFRDSAVEPVVRLSGVLWLEVMGVFFGIFAVFAGAGVWRLRAEWRAALIHPGAHGSLIGAAAMFVLFAYFCVSSFVRAKRREQRRG
jgi:hypothetical protein